MTYPSHFATKGSADNDVLIAAVTERHRNFTQSSIIQALNGLEKQIAVREQAFESMSVRRKLFLQESVLKSKINRDVVHRVITEHQVRYAIPNYRHRVTMLKRLKRV